MINPKNWKQTTLGEVSKAVDYGYTQSASYDPIGPKFLRITDIQDDFIDWSKVPFCEISEKDHKKYKLEVGDVVVARTGNSTGATATMKDKSIDAVFASYLIRFRLDSAVIDFRFVDFLVRSKNWSAFVKSIKGGSAQAGVNAKQLSLFPIDLPPLDDQRSIAAVLSSLDDKIEILRAQNKTLEEMAQRLFKEWFVDFNFPNEDGKPYKKSGGRMIGSEMGEIPEGWRIGRIYEVLKVQYGFAFKSPFFNQSNEGFPLIRIRDLKSGSPAVYTTQNFPSDYLVNEGDILAGMDAEFKPVIWSGKKGGLNQRVCKFSPLGSVGRFFVLEFIRPFLHFFENTKYGTTVSHLGKSDLDSIEAVIPESRILDLFSQVSTPLYEKVVVNQSAIFSLALSRDTLLPKLMSGEIL